MSPRVCAQPRITLTQESNTQFSIRFQVWVGDPRFVIPGLRGHRRLSNSVAVRKVEHRFQLALAWMSHGFAEKQIEENKKSAGNSQETREGLLPCAGRVVREARRLAGAAPRAQRLPLGPRADAREPAHVPSRRNL